MIDPVLRKNFDEPDEVREMKFGRFEILRVPGMTIGRATYQPGWKWSTHVAPTVGTALCNVEHVGLVLAGTATVAFDDGTVVELVPGSLFHVPARPHDSWVVGNEPYVSLHFMGAEHYAKSPRKVEAHQPSTRHSTDPGRRRHASRTKDDAHSTGPVCSFRCFFAPQRGASTSARLSVPGNSRR